MGVMAMLVMCVPRMIYSAGLRALPLETTGEKRTRVRNICKHRLCSPKTDATLAFCTTLTQGRSLQLIGLSGSVQQETSLTAVHN